MNPLLIPIFKQLITVLTSISVVLGTMGGPVLGTQLAVGGKVYYLSGAGVSASASTIGLTKFEIAGATQKLRMADFGDLGCGTIDPGNATKQEFISFTGVTQNSDGTATLSGVSRGLAPISPYTSSTTLQKAHAGGSQFVISNSPPCFYEGYANRTSSTTITARWTYDVYPEISIGDATTSKQIITKSYADNLANNDAATSTESNGGIVELATRTEVASTTASTAAKPLVLQAQHGTSTPGINITAAGGQGETYIVVSEDDGKINQSWLDLTENYTWSGAQVFNTASSTFSGSLNLSGGITASGNLNASGTASLATTTATSIISKHFGGTGKDGVLSISSGTTTINAARSSIITKEYTSISITGTAAVEISNPAQGGTTLFLKSQGDVTITSSNIGIYLVGSGSAGGAAGAAGSTATTTITDDSSHNGLGATNGTGVAGGAVYTNKALYTTPSLARVSRKTYILASGSGGGGGDSGAGAGGGGGGGGGVLILEVGGYLNFTGKINVSGALGSDGATGGGSAGGGGGGGGSSGMALILYNYLTANSGVVTSLGGDGGAGGNGGDNTNDGGGGGGGGGYGAAGGTGGTTNSLGEGGGGGGGASCSSSAGSNGANGVTPNGGAGGAGAVSSSECYLFAQNLWF